MTAFPSMSQIVHTFVLFILLSDVPARAEEPFRTDVYVSGSQGYHTYRIPSLILTPKGTLLAFCEGRKTSRSDHGDIDLVLRRSTDQGATWSPTQIVYEEGDTAEITIGNPCPVIDDATGTIWLPLCRDNRDVLVMKSDDDGVSWSQPVDITRSVKRPDWGWVATGPGVGIQLLRGPHRNRLIVPCDHSEEINGQRIMHSHVMYSDDHGVSWQLGDTVDRHTDECQIVELHDGALLINMRNYWAETGHAPEKGGMRAVAQSRDGGQSWMPLRFDEALIEPVCQASLIRYAHGDSPQNQLLFSNPASKTTRHGFTVRLSLDGGKSWLMAKLLHAGPAAYSCLAVLPDGSIGCLYEAGTDQPYERIIFARFSLDWLKDS